jgi:hypothetical protein
METEKEETSDEIPSSLLEFMKQFADLILLSMESF